jgi:D-serine deaminase-like pyridoxal phosphate-dependent protein
MIGSIVTGLLRQKGIDHRGHKKTQKTQRIFLSQMNAGKNGVFAKRRAAN